MKSKYENDAYLHSQIFLHYLLLAERKKNNLQELLMHTNLNS